VSLVFADQFHFVIGHPECTSRHPKVVRKIANILGESTDQVLDRELVALDFLLKLAALFDPS
jgi:hypothetical protein